MKLTGLYLLSSAAALIVACSTPASESDTPPKPKSERTSIDAPIPTRAMARRNKASYRDLGLGHAIYMRKCGECHLHKLPDEIDSDSWHGIVPGMAWNAGISAEEEKALLVYLQAAATESAQ